MWIARVSKSAMFVVLGLSWGWTDWKAPGKGSFLIAGLPSSDSIQSEVYFVVLPPFCQLLHTYPIDRHYFRREVNTQLAHCDMYLPVHSFSMHPSVNELWNLGNQIFPNGKVYLILFFLDMKTSLVKMLPGGGGEPSFSEILPSNAFTPLCLVAFVYNWKVSSLVKKRMMLFRSAVLFSSPQCGILHVSSLSVPFLGKMSPEVSSLWCIRSRLI